jgi:hypothetical protein
MEYIRANTMADAKKKANTMASWDHMKRGTVRLALGRVQTHHQKWHPHTETACVRASPSAAYLLHTPILPPPCHLGRAPSASPSPRRATLCPFRASREARAVWATRGEGRVTPPIWKDTVMASYECLAGSGRDDAVEGGEERCNTRSTFETSKYATYV